MKSRLLSGSFILFGGFAAGWGVSVWLQSDDTVTRRTPLISSFPESARGRSNAELDHMMEAVHRAGGPTAQMKAARALAESADPAEFQRMLERSRFLPSHSASRLFFRIVLRRWVEADPAAAVRWCAGNSDTSVADAMELWVQRDSSTALAFLPSLTARHREKAIQGCVQALAERDPATALDLLARYSARDTWSLRTAFDRLAGRDPEWLAERSDSLTPTLRTHARAIAAAAMTGKDPAAALAWAQRQIDKTDMLGAVITSCKDPRFITAALAGLPPSERDTIISHHGWDLIRKDPAALLPALGKLEGLSPGSQASLLGNAPYCLRKDPAAAAELLEREFPGQRTMWAGSLAHYWAEKDPAAARAWADSLTNEAERQQALDSIGRREAPEATAGDTALGRVQAKMKRGEYIEQSTVLALTPQERTALLDGDAGRIHFNSNIQQGTKRNFPAEYGAWLASQPASEASQNEMKNFSREWAGEEPAAAAAWVQQLPESDNKAGIAEGIASQWAALDPAEARRWAESLPAGSSLRERALQATAGPKKAQ